VPVEIPLRDLEAIIFDMDGVLCHLDDDARLNHLREATGRTVTEICGAIFESGFEDESDRGAYSAGGYLEEFGHRLNTDLRVEDWVQYRKTGMTPIRESLEVAARLAGSHKLALLTNNGLLLIQEIDVIFPELRRTFGQHLYCSAHFGVQKPEPEVFLQACRRLGSNPAKTLMIDDVEANVAGARAASLYGYHFVSPGDLRDALGL